MFASLPVSISLSCYVPHALSVSVSVLCVSLCIMLWPPIVCFFLPLLLSASVFLSLSISLSICHYISASVFLSLPICLCPSVSVDFSLYLSLYFLYTNFSGSIHLSLSCSIYYHGSVEFCLSVSVPVYVALLNSAYLSLSLSMWLC